MIVAAIAAVAIWLGGPWLAALVLVVSVVAASEWCTLMRRPHTTRSIAEQAAVPAAAVLVLAVIDLDGQVSTRLTVLCATLGIIGAAGALAFALCPDRERRLGLIAGAVYLGVPCVSFLALRGLPDGLSVVFWLVGVVVATDTFAYFVGSTLGGPKLAPAISPGKTWSGLTGGVLAALVFGAITAELIGHSRLTASMLAALLAVLAQSGDLLESWLKRRAGVKDSGGIIPGHGGILDRIDGFTLTTPAMALAMSVEGVS